MKRIFFAIFSTLLLLGGLAKGQNTMHTISGTVIDTTKQTVIGASVKIKTDKGDSTIRVTGIDGKFNFPSVKANKVTLIITSIGYQGIAKHFTFADDGKPLALGSIILKTTSKMLGGVTIVGINPVTLKEDTTQYSAAAYKVRDNAPVEDLVKKLPGVDVDNDGNITTKGKQITKVRINGKDVFGGDVQSITKNLPADVVENIQMIDDYGDQANLTGVKTGEPNQIMNITIRKDKNYGYSANVTGGAGRDDQPKVANDTRYVGLVNSFKFKGDQQLYLLANLNNTNANLFSFGGGGGGFGGGGGGGRGNALRGSGSQSQNGITDVHSLGLNYRDQWGKNLSVYGSYSFADNTTYTASTVRQSTNSGVSNTSSFEHDKNVNHRFTWNMEYKPDTINYLKITPNFSYGSTTTAYNDDSQNDRTIGNDIHYKSTANNTSKTPNFSTFILYNHRFNGHGRNFSAYISGTSTHTDEFQNPVYVYLLGTPPTSPDQRITTGSRVNSIGATLSYLEPLSRRSFLELNYSYNNSHTTSDKEVLARDSTEAYAFNDTLSNDYRYSFITNKVGLNYRFVEKNYNYTLGVGMQPSTLDGFSPMTGVSTHKTTWNFVPTARYIYNFSRSQSFSATYNGSSSQPSFNQLQPVRDRSNALFPVEGNPDLLPEFSNNVNIRYNQFSFASGNTLFLNFNYTQTDHKIVTNSIAYPSTYTPDPSLANTTLTKYLNGNGYFKTGGFFHFAKPWENRKYTLAFTGNVNYTNDIGYFTTVAPTTYAESSQRNVAKTWSVNPGAYFRTDITDVIDTRISANYGINKTNNTVQNVLTLASSNVRSLALGINGKNYLWKDWTVSYDFTRTKYSGYTVPVTNPNILTMYVERRFLKNNMATLRLTGYDLFNQSAGYSLAASGNSLTETSVNRLGRYFLLTLNVRLQKFAGKAPDQGFPGGGGRERHRGRGGMGGGFGGPI